MKILVVAKAPRAGLVKTRLCPTLSHREAALVAEAALADTLDAVAACGADQRWLSLDGPCGDWLPEGFVVVEQRGATFTERLANAWADAGGPALQIGMDTPQVTAQDLDDGCCALVASPGAVLGPALDGGWWALGLMRADPRVFDGVPMNTAETGKRQWQQLHALGLGPDSLPVQRDVDRWQDAVDVAGMGRAGRFDSLVTRLARTFTSTGSVGDMHPDEEGTP